MFEFKEDLETLRRRDAELRTRTNKQAKKVNTKVMSQLEQFVLFNVVTCVLQADVCFSDEAKEADIKRKLGIVLNDKRMIESTISDLDRMKRDTLAKTWEKVTVYVFSCEYPRSSLLMRFFCSSATSVTSSASFCQVTPRSWNLQKERTSWMAWKSRFGWAPSGSSL